ncbi:MAG: hypothetical protein JW874_09745 [Spirochaetales bacterium]|nr:hypothetical protein [Spirochaetales bacterium]
MESYIDFSDAEKLIPAQTLAHLRSLIADAGFSGGGDIDRKVIEAWLLKKASFGKMAEHAGFVAVESMEKDTKSGCCLLTESGSLVFIGPLVGGKRWMSYSSIGFRTDVPKSLSEEGIVLTEDIVCGKQLFLAGGKLEQTSVIANIAMRPQMEPADIQNEQLRSAEKQIKAEFIDHNRRTMSVEKKADTLDSRDDLFNKWIINTWFALGGLEKHVFLARSKMLWLELFPQVYEFLSKEHDSSEMRDQEFLEFTNERFARYCDDYKWYESEKKDFDIGLMKALEELPAYPSYVHFVNDFCINPA